jgi:hypothetical protein
MIRSSTPPAPKKRKPKANVSMTTTSIKLEGVQNVKSVKIGKNVLLLNETPRTPSRMLLSQSWYAPAQSKVVDCSRDARDAHPLPDCVGVLARECENVSQKGFNALVTAMVQRQGYYRQVGDQDPSLTLR